jgi:regulatory protein
MRTPKRTQPVPPVGGTVSSLAGKRGTSERLVVYLDGKRAFDVSAEVAAAQSLRTGEFLTAQAVEALLTEDAPFRAKERALKLIGSRDRTGRDLRSRLEDAGFSDEVAAHTVSWLQHLGYVDDAKFAARYTAEKLRSGWGGRRIASELARLGVDRGLVQQAIVETTDEAGAEGAAAEAAEGGMDAVLDLCRRRFGNQFASDPESAARRLAGFLARRGFDWDTIHKVARILEHESADGSAESGNKQPFS